MVTSCLTSSLMFNFLVEVCGPKINEVDFGLGGGGHQPLLFFTAIFEVELNVKFLICCFSPKSSHVWYQMEGLNTSLQIKHCLLKKI